jgi:iron(III) transport system substrate-binding protein
VHVRLFEAEQQRTRELSESLEQQTATSEVLQVISSSAGDVEPVFDTEETKSTGAMNRLIAEKNNPQADVYWANEPVRAEVLRQQGIAAPYGSPNAHGIPSNFKDPDGYWTGFAARARPHCQ